MWLQRLRRLSPEVRRLLPEAWLQLGWARLHQHRPFEDYARGWGIRMEETSWECDARQKQAVRHISHAVELASRYTPWRSSCLVQAAAAMTLLSRRKLDCTLYLGTAKNAAGRLAAHAWVRSGPIYVTGEREMGAFTVVGTFGRRAVTDPNTKIAKSMSTHTVLKPDRWNEDQELTLLLFLLRKDATSRLDAVHAAYLYGFDWTRLLRLAEHHRVVPAVYLQLKRINHPAIPAELLRNLQAQYHRNTLRMLHLQAEAGRVTRLLMNHGIRVLMLKGPALAQQLYGDVSLRTSKDVDLLIAPDDMDQAEHWMREAGYVSKSGEARVLGSWKWKDHHASFLHPHKRVEIELHWRLQPDAGGEPSFDELWDHRQMSEATATGAPCMYTLGSEHQFLYLSAHGARHGWFRLRWLVDIDRLAVRAVDWEALLPMLRRYGGVPVGGQAWALAAALLGTSVPEPLRQVAATRQAHRLALSALDFIQASVPAEYPVAEPATHQPTSRSYLLSLKGPSHRLMYLISRLLPSTGDPAVLPLPRQLHFLYIPLRPFLWLKRRFSKH
ncbi:hypothetical protein ABIA61_002365 [Paenibacillus sp. RC21]